MIVISFLILFTNKTKNIYRSKKIKLTDSLEIPTPVGDGQHGTSWWLQEKEYNRIFKTNILNCNQKYNEVCLPSAGIIVNFEKNDDLEKFYYIDENFHTIIIGNSGSGKSRSVLIPSITMLGLARRKSFY